MTQHVTTPKLLNSALSRRGLMTGAAWSVPVIVAAVATPLAAASGSASSLAWTSTRSSLLGLNVLDSAATVATSLLFTLPSGFTLFNGSRALTNVPATVTITVARPTGVNIVLGRGRGFGVYSYDGAVTPPASRTVSYVANLGLPTTVYVATHNFSAAANAPLVVPAMLGITGSRAGLAVNLLASYGVTLKVDFGDGNTYSAASSVVVPVGAGIL